LVIALVFSLTDLTCANDDIAGKSSLTVQFVDGHFVESYYPTIENTFSKVIKFKGQEFATDIIDTAGQVSKHIRFHVISLFLGISFLTVALG
jgi:small GTP-binding protein